MSTIPIVRVIVLNWNGRSWLGGCLEALRQQDCGPFEIVLVDNGSTDGSADFVRERFPECRVVALGSNIGFAAGNNAGARGATVPYLAFLNNDTKVDPGWLAALVAAADSDPGVGLVTSRVVFMDRPDVMDSAGTATCVAAVRSSTSTARGSMEVWHHAKCSVRAARRF
jgi:GT2 family glycosyltransferase